MQTAILTNEEITRPTTNAQIRRHPVHAMLASFPIAYFTGALLTDITYWKTAEMMWADFSAWLLFAGLLMGGLAALAELIDLLRNPLLRHVSAAWLHMIGTIVVLLLALLNSFIHSRDAWTSVVPTGLIVSALTLIAMLCTGWLGWSIADRQRVGVTL